MVSVLSPEWQPPTHEDVVDTAQDNGLTVDLNGTQYEVIDGDTLKDTATGARVRFQGLSAPEVAKPDFDSDGTKRGEYGGYESRYNTYKVLKDGSYNDLDFTGETDSYGRSIVRATNDSGEDLVDTLYEAGLVDLGEQSDERSVTAARDGRLMASLFGGSEIQEKYRGLTSVREAQPQVFKGLATNEQWYDPDFYAGVDFRSKGTELWDKDRKQGGATLNPIGQAWSNGWQNTFADLGAAAEAIGVAADWDWLQGVGKNQQVRSAQKLSEQPFLKIQQLSDIQGDGIVDSTFQTLEWLGVNTAMSLPYMAAIVAPALAAAPFTGGSTAAALAVATIPSSVIHTGNVWNQVDPENRDKTAVAKSLAAGVAMASLDALSLGSILKPSQFLTAAGRDIAAKELVKRGATEAAARKQIETVTRKQAQDLLGHMGTQGASLIQKTNLFKNAATKAINAAPHEATTEIAQELTGYLTAAHINGTQIGEAEIDQLLNIALNAGVAGGAVGGALAGGISVFDKVGEHRTRKGFEQWDKSILNEWAQVYADPEIAKSDLTIRDQLVNTKNARDEFHDPNDDGFFNALAEQSKYQPGYLKQHFTNEAGNLDITAIKAIEAVGHASKKLLSANLLSVIKPDDLRENQYLRTLVGRTTNVRGIGGPGQAFTPRRDFIKGGMMKVFGDREFINDFRIGRSNREINKVSQDLVKFGRDGMYAKIKANGGSLDVLTDNEINALGGEQRANTLYNYSQRAERMFDTSHQIEADAIKNEYGADSDAYKNFEKSKIDGYWYKARGVDKGKALKNKAEFTKFVKRKMNEALKDKDLTARDKAAIREMSAEQRVENLLAAKNPDAENYSLVDGTRWASGNKRRLIDMSSDPEFDKYASDNVLDVYQNKMQSVADRVAHLEFFGDGGRDLDYLFRQAYNRERELGLSHEDATSKLEIFAKAYKDSIDSTSHNYNRIKNPTIAMVQRNITSYLTLVGLPLAAFASIPEFGMMMMEVSGNKEASQVVNHAGRELGRGFYNAFKEVGEVANNSIRSSTGVDALSSAGIDLNRQAGKNQDILEALGIDDSPSAIYQKLGVDQSLPAGETMKRVMDTFFRYTGIQGITQVQRRIGAAFATDFAFNRLIDLADYPADQPYTRDMGEKYEQLRALGMDVDTMVDIMRGRPELRNREALNLSSDFVDQIGEADAARVQDEMATFTTNFVNERIQNPNAFNRPLWVQDPQWAMVSLFNGFLSTFTANIVPKLWNDKFGKAVRQRDPSLAYNAFALAMVMLVLGAAGQYLKDVIKYGEGSPYLEGNQIYHRAILSSGLLGQYEKVTDIFLPLYPQRGEGGATRAGSGIVGAPGRAVRTSLMQPRLHLAKNPHRVQHSTHS